MHNNAQITLVGAGPGDPELITLKGLKALSTADVVLYDALLHPDILAHIPKHVELVFVGKQKGVCHYAQEDINQLLVDKAIEKGHVVRLKGGDPFIFGRGHEEIVFAQQHQIKTAVIPGVSSSIAVPELQGVPLTRRGVNDSFFVVTGTTRAHEISNDIQIAAKSNATVVVLMGMTKLEEIMQLFINEGKAETAVGIFQNGSLPNEKIALGTVSNIVEEVHRLSITSPAVIVIGEVVRLHPNFK
jgi:uroporphyrin-III C-methyltransferase